jgi:hypothetical protein
MQYNKLYYLIGLSLLILATQPQAAVMQEGLWRGTLTPSDSGKRYNVHYRLRYETPDQLDSIKILMVNLDLYPTPKFTYKLKKIKIEDDAISFDIPSEYVIRSCELKLDNDIYKGKCTSDQAEPGEIVAKISMIPPEPEPESKPESE